MVTMSPEALSDDALFEHLTPFVQALEHHGFERAAEPTARWRRTRTDPAKQRPLQEEVVIWRHPRYPNALHGHVSTSLSTHSVHLRFFDPTWTPDHIQPGHVGKGFEFDSERALDALGITLRDVILARILVWFTDPVSAETLLTRPWSRDR